MNTKLVALKARLLSEGELELPLQGRCMAPLLVDGDMAKIIPIPQYSIGQLYLFELPNGNLAVHRLIDVTEHSATLKGDRSRGLETVPYKNFIGMVSQIKLFEFEVWIKYAPSKIALKLVTHISRELAKDKRLKGKVKFGRVNYRFRLIGLYLMSNLTRWTWKRASKSFSDS